MQAFEVTGTIDLTGRLTLDQPLQVPHPGRIRMIVLLESSESSVTNNPQIDAEAESLSQPTTQNLSFDPDAQPIWELVAEISAQVPNEEWAKLPTDLARNFDKYQKQRNDR
jgi:hypothetical protein